MADIYCPRCSEPWDLDEFHEVEGLSFRQAYNAFRDKGCEIFYGESCQENNSFKGEAAGILMDLLGDDVDGVAAMLDDFEFVGMLDD